MKPGEGLDRRVLDKVIVALESRLTEHAGHTDRRIAEIDAQVAIDLKAVLHHTAEQNSTFEKAVQQIDSALRASLDAAQRQGAEQILALDQKFTALQDTLPLKSREIVDTVRQAMQQLEAKLTTLHEELSIAEQHWTRIQLVETRLVTGLQALDARASATAELEKALQHASALEARLEVLEQKPQPSSDETVDRAVERVWQSLQSRLFQTAEPGRMHASIAALRQRSAGARQSVMDRIASMGANLREAFRAGARALQRRGARG